MNLFVNRFSQKSAEEFEDEVEYDMDDEDISWLQMINEQRHELSLRENKVIAPIKYDQFEMIMDRLEKELSFEQTNESRIQIKLTRLLRSNLIMIQH